MRLREWINKRPGLAAGLAIVLLAVGIAFITLQGRASGPPTKAYFTTDDGQSYFADDVKQLPPYTYDGKDAVRAHVYACNGKKFVGFLERYTPDGRKMVEAAAAAAKAGQRPPPPPPAAERVTMWGIEVKKPGAKDWIAASNLAKSGVIMNPKCPDGGAGEPVAVEP